MLALGSNGIQAEGARALAPALKLLTSLRDLQLPGNFLGDAGVAALAGAAAAMPGLRVLGLQVCVSWGKEGRRVKWGEFAESEVVPWLLGPLILEGYCTEWHMRIAQGLELMGSGCSFQ